MKRPKNPSPPPSAEPTPAFRSISFSCNAKLLAEIDRRAAQFDLTRSQYINIVIREDLLRGGNLVMHALPTDAPPHGVGRPSRRRAKSGDEPPAAEG